MLQIVCCLKRKKKKTKLHRKKRKKISKTAKVNHTKASDHYCISLSSKQVIKENKNKSHLLQNISIELLLPVTKKLSNHLPAEPLPLK